MVTYETNDIAESQSVNMCWELHDMLDTTAILQRYKMQRQYFFSSLTAADCVYLWKLVLQINWLQTAFTIRMLEEKKINKKSIAAITQLFFIYEIGWSSTHVLPKFLWKEKKILLLFLFIHLTSKNVFNMNQMEQVHLLCWNLVFEQHLLRPWPSFVSVLS